MGRNRMSISAALGIVMFSGVILAALRSGSNDWFKLVYLLTFAVLIYAGIAARHRGPFWHGFAVAGWAYFLAGFGAWIHGNDNARVQRVVNRDLVTSMIHEFIPSLTPPPTPATAKPAASIVDSNLIDWLNGSNLSNWQNAMANRDGIVHSALTLLIASLGGVYSRRLAIGTARSGPRRVDVDTTREPEGVASNRLPSR